MTTQERIVKQTCECQDHCNDHNSVVISLSNFELVRCIDFRVAAKRHDPDFFWESEKEATRQHAIAIHEFFEKNKIYEDRRDDFLAAWPDIALPEDCTSMWNFLHQESWAVGTDYVRVKPQYWDPAKTYIWDDEFWNGFEPELEQFGNVKKWGILKILLFRNSLCRDFVFDKKDLWTFVSTTGETKCDYCNRMNDLNNILCRWEHGQSYLDREFATICNDCFDLKVHFCTTCTKDLHISQDIYHLGDSKKRLLTKSARSI